MQAQEIHTQIDRHAEAPPPPPHPPPHLRAHVALAHVASTWPDGSPAALRACAHFTGVPSCSPQHERAHAGNKAALLRLFYCSKAAVMAMHLDAASPFSLQPNRLTLHSAHRPLLFVAAQCVVSHLNIYTSEILACTPELCFHFVFHYARNCFCVGVGCRDSAIAVPCGREDAQYVSARARYAKSSVLGITALLIQSLTTLHTTAHDTLSLTTGAPMTAPTIGQGMKLHAMETRIRMHAKAKHAYAPAKAYASANVKLTASGMARTLPTPYAVCMLHKIMASGVLRRARMRRV
jgi:hypothetical protein